MKCLMSKLPVVSGQDVIHVLLKAGFEEIRQKGSHVSLRKETVEISYKTVVPLHKELAGNPDGYITSDRFVKRRFYPFVMI